MRGLVKSSGILLLGIISVSFLVQGCVSTQGVMDSWMNSHQSDLIASWGPPTRTTSDGKGGSILIYEKYVDLGQSPGKAQVDIFGNVTYTSPNLSFAL